jgi:hypothetical protein
MEMVELEELKQILHDEKMKQIASETAIKQEKIERQKRKDKDLFKCRDHWTGLPNSLTDIARSINPPRSKILDKCDRSMNRLEAHYYGIVHGMCLRVGAMALFCLIYVWPF